jgi:hypothetical protein
LEKSGWNGEYRTCACIVTGDVPVPVMTGWEFAFAFAFAAASSPVRADYYLDQPLRALPVLSSNM